MNTECCVCLGPAVDNRECVHCRNLYCGKCITMWLSSGHAQTCPTCRRPATLEQDFVLNEKVDGALNDMFVPCDMCNKEVRCKDLPAHQDECRTAIIKCPFNGCAFTADRDAMDKHTLTCSLFSQYNNVTAIVDGICKRAAWAINGPEVLPASLRVEETRRRKALCDREATRDRLQQDNLADDESFLVHTVQMHDTLAGLAIKYNTSREDIMKLNSIHTEAQLYTKATILVSKPTDWQPEKEDPIPIEVLVALKKKAMTRKLMSSRSLTKDEAVAYLHFTHYNMENAVSLAKADEEWLLANSNAKKCASLKEFVNKLNAGLGSCGSCSRALHSTTERNHCQACGQFFCSACCDSRAECSLTLQKKYMHVTNPETMDDAIRVCNRCHAAYTSCQHASTNIQPPHSYSRSPLSSSSSSSSSYSSSSSSHTPPALSFDVESYLAQMPSFSRTQTPTAMAPSAPLPPHYYQSPSPHSSSQHYERARSLIAPFLQQQ